jgi:hypothetical protein
MKAFIGVLSKLGLFRQDLDYHLVRTSMVIMFFFFGYQKWWDYEAQVLIPSACGFGLSAEAGCTESVVGRHAFRNGSVE